MLTVTVVCPEGVGPGELILIAIPSSGSSQDVEVAVPEGFGPGDEFEVFIDPGGLASPLLNPRNASPGFAIIRAPSPVKNTPVEQEREEERAMLRTAAASTSGLHHLQPEPEPELLRAEALLIAVAAEATPEESSNVAQDQVTPPSLAVPDDVARNSAISGTVSDGALADDERDEQEKKEEQNVQQQQQLCSKGIAVGDRVEGYGGGDQRPADSVSIDAKLAAVNAELKGGWPTTGAGGRPPEVSSLKKRARDASVDDQIIGAADDADNPRESLIGTPDASLTPVVGSDKSEQYVRPSLVAAGYDMKAQQQQQQQQQQQESARLALADDELFDGLTGLLGEHASGDETSASASAPPPPPPRQELERRQRKHDAEPGAKQPSKQQGRWQEQQEEHHAPAYFSSAGVGIECSSASPAVARHQRDDAASPSSQYSSPYRDHRCDVATATPTFQLHSYRTALVGGNLMKTKLRSHAVDEGDWHYIEMELVRGRGFTIGLGCGTGPDALDVEAECDEQAGFWGVCDYDGSLCHHGYATAWSGQEGFGSGDTIGLLLELYPAAGAPAEDGGDSSGGGRGGGNLSMFKNGKRLGLVVASGGGSDGSSSDMDEDGAQGGGAVSLFRRGAQAGLCWAVGLGAPGASVRIISAARPPC
eukprot:COSAG05_NODE_10_length_39559_cov_64.255423_23_plen_648_part_00